MTPAEERAERDRIAWALDAVIAAVAVAVNAPIAHAEAEAEARNRAAVIHEARKAKLLAAQARLDAERKLAAYWQEQESA
jgi:hypothetical protein